MKILVETTVNSDDIDDVRGDVAELAREHTLLAWNRLVDTTPVDTGTARSGWDATPGAPSLRLPPPGIYGRPNQPFLPLLDPEDSYYITNNVPYIDVLNGGHSAQAPAMFVEMAFKYAEVIMQGKIE